MENIDRIISEALALIQNGSDLITLDQIRIKYLGKKGQFTDVLKTLGTLDPVERPKFGQIINSAKKQLEDAIQTRSKILETELLEKSLLQETIDVTLPASGQSIGSNHPVSLVSKSIEDYFVSMGFTIFSGPEIEDEYHNFTALNVPENHPARAQHDTFYLQNGMLLRTHTSPTQIRAMRELKNPPFKIITPGRVYRCDSDATHSPMFHQIEGFVVDEKINFGNLKWMLNNFLEYFFAGSVIETRFRPSYFPFTEPSAEVDVSWEVNGKKRWLEVLGCGMVHPKVLEAGGIDSERYSGFAFGLGLDRFAMLRYGIKDLRMFFENDLRFLKQYSA